MDPRIISYFFIDYPKGFKGYRFYYPNHHTRIVETNNEQFLKNRISSESHDKSEVVLLPKEVQSDILEISPIIVSQRMEDQSSESMPLHTRVIDIDTTSKSITNSTPTVL